MFVMYYIYIMGVFGSSLLIESTDSIIIVYLVEIFNLNVLGCSIKRLIVDECTHVMISGCPQSRSER